MDQGSPRQMYQGNWPCSGCDKMITELPFEPRDTSNLLCRDCFAQNRPQRQERTERKMYQGNWPCSECDQVITELPFEPRDGSSLKCKDCFVKSR